MISFSNNPHEADQQVEAVIFYLTAFGYIDGSFDQAERTFVQAYIQRLLHARAASAHIAGGPGAQGLLDQWNRQFQKVFNATDRYIASLFTEAVSAGEDMQSFVYTRLKLRAFEVFQSFDRTNQRALLASCEELIAADGVVHPEEERFRDEVKALLEAELPERARVEAPIDGHTVTLRLRVQTPPSQSTQSHPLLDALEVPFSTDGHTLMRQAGADYQLISRTLQLFDEQRRAGAGKLMGRARVQDLVGEDPFLDGFVYAIAPKPGRAYQILVLGDLHGCYTCLKAALMQFDFFRKAEAWRRDPYGTPEPRVVFLGDYIDRGIRGLEGVLRTALTLFVNYPELVHLLRGNHEWFTEKEGIIQSGVLPAETINTWLGPLPMEHFAAYKRLFDYMPSAMLFDQTMLVHAGIPRDEVLEQRWQGLPSLNDPEMRFHMMWSDPSTADYVPMELQRQSVRFAFGRNQFRRFMSALGMNTLVRGHEKVDTGFAEVYEGDTAVRLVTVFSSGGADNADLPAASSYRAVTPMAMTITYRDGEVTATPWEIDYRTYNTPDRNGFLRI